MQVRGILIDPVKRTVEEVQVDIPSPEEGGARSIKAHLGIPDGSFDMVRLARNAALWVDDEGMTREGQHFFAMPGFYPNPLAGRGLVTGINGPDTVGIDTPVALVAANVKWVEVEFAGFEDTSEDDVEIAPGIKGTRLSRTATFKAKDKT